MTVYLYSLYGVFSRDFMENKHEADMNGYVWVCVFVSIPLLAKNFVFSKLERQEYMTRMVNDGVTDTKQV